MLTKFTAIIVFALVINLTGVSSLYAQAQTNREEQNVRKIKTKVAKIFGSKRGKVTIKYKDGKKIKGYISEIKDDTFGVSDSKTGSIANIEYAQVKSVSNNSLPTAAKIAIGVAAGLGVLIVIAGISLASGLD